MIIIIGLGNPGKEYQNTPHNVGFEFLEYFAERNEFPAFEFSKYSNALISRKDSLILAKPQSFMNSSGLVIQNLIRYSKFTGAEETALSIQNLIIIHDDLDLMLGKYKISKNRGSAGHKGVESIIKALKTEDFTRVRIGVSKEKKPDVLKKLGKRDQETLRVVFEKISLELEKK